MQVLNMSSFLKCLHNTDIPNGFLNFLTPRKELKKVAIYLGLPGLFDDDFEYIVRRSKFMVKQCFNPSTYLPAQQLRALLEDYVSEKAWQALNLGAVPIYLGAPNVADILPDGSFINLRHYATSQGTYDVLSLKAKLDRALESPEEYARYHAWRLPNLDVKFMKLLARNGNSQTFVYNRKLYGDRKRLTCDLCSYVLTMQQKARHTHNLDIVHV